MSEPRSAQLAGPSDRWPFTAEVAAAKQSAEALAEVGLLGLLGRAGRWNAPSSAALDRRVLAQARGPQVRGWELELVSQVLGDSVPSAQRARRLRVDGSVWLRGSRLRPQLSGTRNGERSHAYLCLPMFGRVLVIDGRLGTPYEAMTLPRARRPNESLASRAAGHSLTPRSLNRGPQEVGWKIRTESLDSPPQCSDARARSMEALVPSTGIAGLLAAAR